MNFVGHLATAVDDPRWPEPGFRVGLVAPDLGARVPLLPSSPMVAAGLAEHRRADAAFHGLPWFRSTTQVLARDLEAAGVRRGPARATAHVGCELLLDGELVHDPVIAAALAETWAVLADHGPEVAGMVAPAGRDAWRRHLAGFVAAVDPQHYADPAAVALAVHRILARRPRLALVEAERSAVAAVLTRHARVVQAGARAAVAASASPPPA